MESPPPPMSFPAILRNPGLSGRFAHLQVNTLPLHGAPTAVKKLKREHEGKRWIRRKENGNLVSEVPFCLLSDSVF